MVEKKYVSLEKLKSTWFTVKKNDVYLRSLAFIFEESSGFLNSLIGYMSDPKCKGYGGNAVKLKFYNNKIKIMFSYADEPDEEAFIIEKDLLIKIIRAWQKLVKQEPQEITIYQDGDVYTLEGLLGNGEKVTDIVS